MKMILLIICLIFGTGESLAQEIVDLGIEGRVCKIKPLRMNSLKQADHISINNKIRVQFDGTKHMSRWQSEDAEFDLENYPQNKIYKKTIFVFSATDASSIEKAKEIKTDYGLCIKYNSLEDIKSFREQSKAMFPIALGNEQMIRFFKITHVPCLITIQNGKVTVETDI